MGVKKNRMNTKDIIKKAKKKGLCKEWFQEMMENDSFENLSDRYFKGSDWALENDFPPIEIMQKVYKETEKFGLMLDKKGDFLNTERVALFGKSDVNFKYDGYSVGTIIARHGSKIDVTAKGNSILFINILDSVEAHLRTEDDAKIYVYMYGIAPRVYTTGNVIMNILNSKK